MLTVGMLVSLALLVLYGLNLGSVLEPHIGAFFKIYFALFGLPHILISLAIFYSEQRREGPFFPALKVSFFIAILICVYLLNELIFELFFLILISWHVSGQLIGSVKFWYREDRDWVLYKILALGPILTSFMIVYSRFVKVYFTEYLYLLFKVLWVGFLLFFISKVLRFQKKSGHVFQLYVSTGLFILAFSMAGYYQNFLLGTTLFLFGHDLTAIGYYRAVTLNKRLFRSVRGFYCFFSIIAAISMVIVFSSDNFAFLRNLLFASQLAHYIIESFIWKSGSENRQYLVLKASS